MNILDNGQNNFIVVHDSVTSNPNKKTIIISGNNNKITIHSGVQLHDSLINVIGSNCNIEIHENCRFINGNLILNQESSIIIGARTTWASGAFRAEHNSEIRIGKDCMFSADIHIRTSDGHGIFDVSSKKLINSAKNVEIMDHVWLGHSSRINKGTKIGTCTVLGQMSLANGILDSYSVYAGVPAKK